MSRLEIRLLGGFDVRLEERAIRNFESQKVRALLAYLATHPQAVGRDHLAALLWAEKPDSAARRNLRQALHNLRSAFAAAAEGVQILLVSHREIQLNPALDCWLDVEKFEEAIRRGFLEGGPDPYQLTIAASLYSGDFLTGFFIRDSPPFEEWMVAEQERHRESAIETFRSLIEAYMRRGEYRLGIQYGRRLLAIDPLSESAHCFLMKLYALSGRRSRALSQYESLRNVLNEELAVEPLTETQELFQSILMHDVPSYTEAEEEGQEPVGPLIPLVGRREPFARLQSCWERVTQGEGRLSLLLGESGVGKTRLARSFVDAATAKRTALVLRGRAYASAPLVSYGLFSEILTGAFTDILPEDCKLLAEALDPRARADMLALAPQIGELAPDLGQGEDRGSKGDPEGLSDSVLALLDQLSRLSPAAPEVVPVILMADDLHWADEPSLELLAALSRRIQDRAVWILALGREMGGTQRLANLAQSADDHIELPRLTPAEVQEIAASLVGISGSEELGGTLAEWSRGLPLAVAELINFLWDEGVLVPRGGGQWSLRGGLEELTPPPLELPKLIQMRIRRLPTSARRLLAIAAIIGQRFDAELVQAADREHLAVVDICVQLMLERWLIRQFPMSWSHSRRDRDLVLWAKGMRRGSFEFAHESIRDAILQEINPLRKQTMHRDVAAALRASRGQEEETICEELAYHEVAGGEWEKAVPSLERAAMKASRIGVGQMARWYYERCLEALTRLASGAASGDARQQFARRRDEILSRLDSEKSGSPA